MPLLKNSDPTRCPNCGERVTPDAAGCSLCGESLDPQRWQRPSGLVGRSRALWRAVVGESRTR
jgi:predicted amidophosphoribosyltransferase